MKFIILLSLFFLTHTVGFGQGWFWQNPLPQGNPLHSVSFPDPLNGTAVGIAGTIVRTTDGGENWILQTSVTTNDLYGVSFADSTTGFAVGGSGTILRTTDGGESWISQTAPVTDFLSAVVTIDALTATAVGGNGTILRTTDGGTTWFTQLSGTVRDLLGVSFSSLVTGTAVGALGRILHTTDGGTTWVRRPVDNWTWCGVSFTNDTTGTIVGDEGKIMRTTDGGATWVNQKSGTTEALRGVSFADEMRGTVVGWLGRILDTTDGGTTWITQGGGYPLTGVSLTDSTTGFVVGDAGRILRTTDGGLTWVSQTTGTTDWLDEICFTNKLNGSAVGANRILHTADGGETWTESASTEELISTVFFTDAMTGIAAGNNGTMLHTTDGGKMWEERPSGTNDWFLDISFSDRLTGTAIVPNGGILRTTDGGSSWVPQSSGTETFLREVSLLDDLTGTIVGSDGLILRTTDGGTNWVSQSSGTTNSLWAVSFADRMTGLAVGSNGTILWTGNGGETWTPQSSGTDNTIHGVCLISPLIGVAAGAEGLILHTTDGGATWSSQWSGTTNWLNDIFFSDAATGNVVGHYGTIRRTGTGGTGIEPPQAPTLSMPPDSALVSTSPRLVWNTTSGAIWYTIQVSRTPLFYNYEVNVAGIDSNDYQAPDLTVGETYYWRVSATSDSGTSGWSEMWSFMTTGPPAQVDLESPPDRAVVFEDSVGLVWRQAFPEVDRYWLEGATDSLFSNPFIDSTLTDTIFTVSPIHHDQTFWWKVRAHNSVGWGSFSDAWSFFVYQEVPAPPVLLFPDSGAVDVSTSPILSWNPSVGSEFYTVQLSDSDHFTTLLVEEDSLTEPSLQISDLSNEATYFWRAGAGNNLGQSDWSEVWNFTTLVTGVEAESELPNDFNLLQNYPNPFNPSTTIRYELPKRSHVRIEVFNLVGERVTLLIDGDQEAAYHSVVFYVHGLASGIYLYRMQAGDFVETRKLVLIK